MVTSFSSHTGGVIPNRRRHTLVSPAFSRLPPPVIIVGMHRSGTSLVSGMLSLMGVYLDPAWPRAQVDSRVVPPGPLMRRNGYGEAQAFRLLNERLLQQAGSDWDDPAAFLELRSKASFERKSLLTMQSATFSSLKRQFLYGLPYGPHAVSAWGWKDPRTSLTLPYWLHLFPDARVLHVRRDPEKIADSLIKRALAGGPSAQPISVKERLVKLATDPKRAISLVRRRMGLETPIVKAGSVLDRDYCHELTERYVSECERFRVLGSRYTEIHHEDILLAPRTLATQLAEFAGIEVTPEVIEQAAAFVSQDNILPVVNAMTRIERAPTTDLTTSIMI